MSMFGDNADAQLMNEFGKDQRRLMDECGEAQLHGVRTGMEPAIGGASGF